MLECVTHRSALSSSCVCRLSAVYSGDLWESSGEGGGEEGEEG